MTTPYFLGMAIGSAIAFGANCASAQITPDSTLPNNSIVTTDGSTLNITGGTQAGKNLFHSFSEFSVPNGGTASFNNAIDIGNIISRVTGGSVSNIDGLIKANGTANLFLINPNGIIFGQGARLDIGGSFVATTASAIGFGDQGFFSAENPESSSSLLTVNPSALLFNQIKTASIENNSVATGLRVPDGNSLLLVGGDINMDGGGLLAFGGRVDLGGLKGTGTIGLNSYGNNLSLSFPDSVERSDVLLSRGSFVYVVAGDGGSIAVNAQNLKMTGRSFLFAGIDGALASENSKAGNIEVNATGVINLDNNSSIANQVRPEAAGQGGDINISTRTLRIESGAFVTTSIFGAGKSGNLSVDAQDVQIIGRSADGRFASGLFASAQRNSTGDAGDLTIKTNTLLIKDGAKVFTGTWGGGKGGNLSVDAQDVQLIGTSADSRFASGLFADSQSDSTGDAGDLTIKTNTLLIKDGAQVFTGTWGGGKGGNLSVDAQDVQIVGTSADSRFASGLFADSQSDSTGDAGDLTIKTNTLLLKDGAQVITGTRGEGKGGNLNVDAQDVQIIGRSAYNSRVASGLLAAAAPNSTGDAGDLTIKTNTLLLKDGAQVNAGTWGGGKGGNLSVDAQDVQIIGTSADSEFISGLFASAQPNSTGDAGDLTIKTNTLLVQDGSEINVQSSGIGTAGIMTLNARSIRLNNNAVLRGNTQSARFDPSREQATININSESLIMSRNSNIITNATGKDVIGGNINIDTDFLIAFGNSDISANSDNFRGGRVQINASGIFGTQFRDVASNSTSDITATGASPELNGTVELNTPGIDPNSGLVELPTIPVDTQVAQGCYSPGYAQNRFVITGRGGLPANPKDILTPDATQIDWVSFKPSNNNRSLPPVTNKPTTSTPKRIVEATGAVLNAKGQIVLSANSSTATPHTSRQNPIQCHGS
ncbi:filamentous hemagglutinin N-terminal domain-containing protein [Nostoc sp. CHAB 5715]|uniref:two-partner secretion domain-containing protein n=1 Tax=Nostoc sp. CHAB 5715 TaxID=2780400 RepID=UPI001E2DE13A|nr:filamentous hemagglutinin N-terminal domain-containing protein [Nostoc sp. CHAB 5715]MCC5620444.1 filamentous hemagglutinin N-terminal domain-containing protein [Nostoc sp. CHAB 5715]